MSRIDIESWDEEEHNNFEVMGSASNRSGPRRNMKGMTPEKKIFRKLRVVDNRNLEDFKFFVNDARFEKGRDSYLTGFEELDFSFRYADAMSEFTNNFKGLPEENHWLDNSFVAMPPMVKGIHPVHGDVVIHDHSFLFALSNGLSGVDECYKEMGYEVKGTIKDRSKKLINLMRLDNVYLTPQIIMEMHSGSEGLKKILGERNRKSPSNLTPLKTQRKHAKNLLESAIDSCQQDNLVEDIELERRLFNYCQHVADMCRTGTGIADNHLVAYALTRAIESGEPQTVLTRDWGISRLTNGIENSSARRPVDYNIPDFNLSGSYYDPTGLHSLVLSLR